MSVTITNRKPAPALTDCNCRAHEGKIKYAFPVTYVTLDINGSVFTIPVCRPCNTMTDSQLIAAMIAEARRYNSVSEPTGFTKAIAREEV